MSNQVYANDFVAYIQPIIDNIDAEILLINSQLTILNNEIAQILPQLPIAPISNTGILTGPFTNPPNFTIKLVKTGTMIDLYWAAIVLSSNVASFTIDTNVIIPVGYRPAFDFMFSTPMSANSKFYNSGIVRILTTGIMSFALTPSGTQMAAGVATGPLGGHVTYFLS